MHSLLDLCFFGFMGARQVFGASDTGACNPDVGCCLAGAWRPHPVETHPLKLRLRVSLRTSRQLSFLPALCFSVMTFRKSPH